MTRNEAIETQLDEIMDQFDFRKVAEHMSKTNWKWHDAVPDEYEIRQRVRQRIRKLAKEHKGDQQEFCGGFLIKLDENVDEKWLRIGLYFVIEWHDEDGTEYSI
jgi:hypothetical protein